MDAQAAVRNALRDWARKLTNRELAKKVYEIQTRLSATAFSPDAVGEYGAVLTEAVRRLNLESKTDAAAS